jgi:hypothetical protein
MLITAMGGNKGARRRTLLTTIPLWGAVLKWERLNPTGCPGNVGLDKVTGRFVCTQHWLNPLDLFNHVP